MTQGKNTKHIFKAKWTREIMKTTLHYDPNDKLAFNSRILNPPYNHNILNSMTQSYLVRCIKSQTIITGHYTRPILSVRLYGRGYVDRKLTF